MDNATSGDEPVVATLGKRNGIRFIPAFRARSRVEPAYFPVIYSRSPEEIDHVCDRIGCSGSFRRTEAAARRIHEAGPASGIRRPTRRQGGRAGGTRDRRTRLERSQKERR